MMRITGLQLGYESRCARPQAFDVMLGSQLGVGAYRALVERRLDGVMVSVSGQLDLNYVPFNQLVDPATLDRDMAAYGLEPAEPTVLAEGQAEVGRRVSVNGLYRRRSSGEMPASGPRTGGARSSERGRGPEGYGR